MLCETEEAQEVAKEMFAQIFSSLILRIGVSVVIESTKKPLCVRYITKYRNGCGTYLCMYHYFMYRAMIGLFFFFFFRIQNP